MAFHIRSLTGAITLACTMAFAMASNTFAESEAVQKTEASSKNQVGKQNRLKDERDVIAQMASAGYPDFVLLNKRTSKLYLIQDSDFFLQTPIIFGRGQGQKNLTPSGVFSLTNSFQGATSPSMIFYLDHTGAYMIHGVVRGREWAFNTENRASRQLSDGCINIPDEILPYVSGFARQKAMANPNGKATPFIVMEEKYDAGKFARTLKSFAPAEYNPD